MYKISQELHVKSHKLFCKEMQLFVIRILDIDCHTIKLSLAIRRIHCQDYLIEMKMHRSRVTAN